MTRKVLIVSPHFPPVNAPDMQRVRMSLPFYAEFGWEPVVLAAAPSGFENIDPLLVETVPTTIHVERVDAVPQPLARAFGVGNLAVRAIPGLYAAGCRLLETRDFDLVYFSTSMFLTMPLGRVWKKKFRIPYVLDFQDPWISDYYETHPGSQPPAKYGAARRVHAVLEPWTLAEADGLIAVSPDYIDALHRRYPWMRGKPSATLPFGASRADFELLEKNPQGNRDFARDGRIHGVYAGRGGDDLSTALDILFRALQSGLRSAPDLFAKVALHFVGTDYATDDRARKTVEPVAARLGVGSHVSEHPGRRPYFEALQLLKDADFLMVVGSDDAAYTASKVYPYVLAEKPLIAVMHERSTAVDVLRDTNAGFVVTFPTTPTEEQKAAAAELLTVRWADVLMRRSAPATDWARFERYTSREMTRRQCEVFDDVVASRRATAA